MRSLVQSFKRVSFGLALALVATASEAQPALTVFNPAPIVEGTVASATINLNFVVTKPAGLPASFSATTFALPGQAIGGAAIAGGVDYINLPTTTFSMLAAETSKNVSVQIVRDNLDELSPETFRVDFVALGGATINGAGTTASAFGSITDDDVATISITDVSFNEGAGTATLTISQNVPSTTATSVNFTVANNTAISPKDYTTITLGGPTGTRSFAAAPTSLLPPPSHALVIDIVDDLLDEPTEDFRITLTGPTGGAILAGAGGSVGIGTILDTPDPQPVISINSISLPEGSPSGMNNTFIFTVSLSIASGRTIPVTVTTSNGTAVQPGDYSPKTQIFSFTEGSGLTRQFVVTVFRDVTPEPDETFFATLTGVNFATVGGGGVGVGTIQNDDAGIQINDVAIDENTGSLVFTVTRTATAGIVTFNYATSGGTAIGGASCAVGTDYLTTSGPGSIPASAGVATYPITVPVCPDGDSEGHDTFNVTLTSVVGATLVDGLGVGTIRNDDAVPSGALKISEFRYNGPNGALDQFVEIANTTSSPITIGTLAPDLSAGFAVASAGSTLFVIPNGETIPAGGHFLGTNTGYSLDNYGGVAAATGNAAFLGPLGVDQGIALFDTAAFTGLTTPLDAVGFVGNGSQYFEVTGITPLAITPGVAANHSFVRRYVYGAGTGLQDGNGSSADWALVATDPGADVSLGTALLGGPSPDNLAAENDRLNSQLTVSGSGSVFTGVPGPGPVPVPAVKALEFRRTFTNNGAPLSFLRFQVSGLTGVNNPVPGQADLRPTDSATVTTFQGLTLEALPGTNYTLTTPSFGLFPAGTNLNGGLNSTLRLSSGLPLANLGTVDVNFRVEYTTSGAPYYFWLVPQGK